MCDVCLCERRWRSGVESVTWFVRAQVEERC